MGDDCAEPEAGMGGPRVALREGKKQRWLVRTAFHMQKKRVTKKGKHLSLCRHSPGRLAQ